MTNPTIKSIDSKGAKMLSAEIGKVRCWLAGFHAGHGDHVALPGEDSLRQVQVLLETIAREPGTPEDSDMAQ